MTTEQEIIWLLMNQPEISPEVLATFSPSMFHTPEMKRIFSKFYEGNNYLDEADYSSLWPIQESGAKWVPWIPKAMRERLRSEFRGARVGKVFASAMDRIREGKEYRDELGALAEIEDSFERTQKTPRDLRDKLLMDHSMEQANEGSTKGYRTGSRSLDETTDRLKKGHFWVVAGYTNFGKTTLAMQLSLEAMRNGARVDFISLEMSAEQLYKKLAWLEACGMGSDPKSNYRRGLDAIADLPMSITENVRDIKSIEAHIKSNPSKADMFVVDYIQLVGGGESFYDSATQISNTLQAMAITKNIHVMALSQITKEAAKSGASYIMDFKNSGGIGDSADVAIEIHREKDNEATIAKAILFIKKNRHGRTGKIECEFDTGHGRFILGAAQGSPM